MNKQCVNCPGRTDHTTAECWVRASLPDGYMPIPTAKQISDALESVRCFHDMSAELIAPELLANLLASTTVKESLSVAPSLPVGEVEEVEVDVVAWRYRHSEQEKWQAGVERKSLWETEPLMTVAQHKRLMAAEIQKRFDGNEQSSREHREELAQLAARDAGEVRVPPEFCCELSYKAAKQKAWNARRIDRCKCDHNEYCDHCWPDDFREGGKWHGKFVAQQSAHVSVPREWLDAVKELFDAKQAKEDFERENPGNSTKRWDACLYRIEAAEDALRALLNGGEA